MGETKMEQDGTRLKTQEYNVRDRDEVARLAWMLRLDTHLQPKDVAETLNRMRIVDAERRGTEWNEGLVSSLLRQTQGIGFSLIVDGKESSSPPSAEEENLWKRAIAVAEQASARPDKKTHTEKATKPLSPRARELQRTHRVVPYGDVQHEIVLRSLRGETRPQIDRFLDAARVVHNKWIGDGSTWSGTTRSKAIREKKESQDLRRQMLESLRAGGTIKSRLFPESEPTTLRDVTELRAARKETASASAKTPKTREKRAASFLLKTRPELVVAPKDAVRYEAIRLRVVEEKNNREIAKTFGVRGIIHDEWAKREAIDGVEPWEWTVGMISNLITGCDITAKKMRDEKKVSLRRLLHTMNKAHERGETIPTHPDMALAIQARDYRIGASTAHKHAKFPYRSEAGAEIPILGSAAVLPDSDSVEDHASESVETRAEPRIVLTIDGEAPRFVPRFDNVSELHAYSGISIATIIADGEICIDLITAKMNRIARHRLREMYGVG